MTTPLIPAPAAPAVPRPAAAEPPSPLALRVDDDGATAVVTADGEIDMCTAPRLAAALAAVRCADVVLDLRGVAFVDCAGIGLLADARRRARARGARLRIVPSGRVTRTAALLALSAELGLS